MKFAVWTSTGVKCTDCNLSKKGAINSAFERNLRAVKMGLRVRYTYIAPSK